MGVKDDSLVGYIASVAAPTPTPGGGSVSAIVGALSVALARMVAGLARDKKGYEAVQEDLRQIEGRAIRLQDRLLTLADRDSAAYERVVLVMRMPKGTGAERASRVEAMQVAYRTATEVPLETMEACVEALELAAAAAEKGNRGAGTDAAVAVLLAEAGLRGASLNVRVNLASIKDESFRTNAEERAEALLKRGDAISRQTMAMVTSRL